MLTIIWKIPVKLPCPTQIPGITQENRSLFLLYLSFMTVHWLKEKIMPFPSPTIRTVVWEALRSQALVFIQEL